MDLEDRFEEAMKKGDQEDAYIEVLKNSGILGHEIIEAFNKATLQIPPGLALTIALAAIASAAFQGSANANEVENFLLSTMVKTISQIKEVLMEKKKNV